MLRFDGLLDRVISPRPLLAGVVVGLAACAYLGHAAGRAERIPNFTRFTSELNYLTNYQVSANQVRTVARTAVRPDQIAVVVTGNSILYGSGQGAADVWTRRLQAELGDGYRVLNFALPGIDPQEFGALAAEMLYRDGHRRVIVVTNTWLGPTSPIGEPDGRPNIQWFFWDAHARGLLLDSPEREARMSIPLTQRADAGLPGAKDPIRRGETERQAALDRWLNFRDLWNAFEYERGVTVRCKPLGKKWWRPRKTYPDSDPTCPPASPALLKSLESHYMETLRSTAKALRPVLRRPSGEPIPGSELGGPFPAEGGLRAAFPPPMRERLIVIANRVNPYYLDQLTPDERATYEAMGPAMAAVYARVGVAVMEVGRGYGPGDYYDPVHLTAAGGQRLAAELAPLVRRKAAELGFLEEGTQP